MSICCTVPAARVQAVSAHLAGIIQAGMELGASFGYDWFHFDFFMGGYHGMFMIGLATGFAI
ncbi:MAG TPA: hypothetical protein PK297_13460 [Spirochaetota bacterium]|nr:hypothetical protein [Spirochaetota bacterium]